MAHLTSASAPVGSIVFSLFALLAISLGVLLLLRYYLPLRTTPAFYLVPIFFALWLPAIIILLVPIDLASSAATDDEATRGIWLPHRVVLVSWRITYWLTFALTWFILPIQAEYSDSGYREPQDKLKYSLRANAQFYALTSGAALVGLLYVAIAYRLTFESLKALVMALSYCWGLVLAIYLMGHGLVSIPRRFIRSANIGGRLRRLQAKAPKIHEQMEDAIIDLEEIEVQVSELGRRKVGSAVDFQDWIEELQELANIPSSQPSSVARSAGFYEAAIPTVITEKYLADLARRLVRARHTRSRRVDEWNRLVGEASELQAIMDSAASKQLDFGQEFPRTGFGSKSTILTPYTRHLCYYYLFPYARLLLGLLLALASGCIIWSEVVKFPFPALSVIRLSVIHHWVGDKAQVGLAGQMISALWICYMCAAALTSVTEVRVWRGRALVKRKTAHESAFWYASQVAKLCVPLSYNFMTFLSSEVYKKTTFYHFLGRLIDFTLLGRWFDHLFPFILLLPVIATLFGLYGRVRRLFVGADMMDDDDDDNGSNDGNLGAHGSASWREGRNLIEREIAGGSLAPRHHGAVARLAVSDAPSPPPAPGAHPPGFPNSRPSGARPPPPRAAPRRPTARPAVTPYRDDDEAPDDEGFLQVLGHRMRNTFETMEPPRWLQDLGQGLKQPRWMTAAARPRPTPARPLDEPPAASRTRRWFAGSGPPPV